MRNRIVKQLNTEKTHKMLEKNIYSFLFPVDMRKNDIKKIIEKTFSVKVDNVKTLLCPKREKTFRGKTGVSSRYKKAYIAVAKGMKIDVEGNNVKEQ